jgi:hypothetical protein
MMAARFRNEENHDLTSLLGEEVKVPCPPRVFPMLAGSSGVLSVRG